MPLDPESTPRPRPETPTFAAHYDVVIVGAGVAGCAVAQSLALADKTGQRNILVVDLHKDVSPRFSGEMIHPKGADVLDQLGFYEPLRQAGAVDVPGFSVLEHAGAEALELRYDDLQHQRPMGLSVHHKTLIRVMRRFIEARPNISLRAGFRVVDLLREGDRVGGVVIKDGSNLIEVSADLVVAADGKASSTRKLAGIIDERTCLGFTAGVEIVDAAVPHPMAANVILGAVGPVLCYPIESRGDGSVVYRMTFDLPNDLPAKGRDLGRYIQQAFVPYLPQRLAEQTHAAIEARIASAPLEMAPTFNLPAPPASRPGLCLVGDAAGCSHPITASGMTMGLLDALTLGEQARQREASAGKVWIDERAIRRYRAQHDRYVPTRQALADAIYESFRGEGVGARAIQKALFSYWRASPANRRRSLALLSCAEGRPRVFLSEYLRAAGHAVRTGMRPDYAPHYPMSDRLRRVGGAVEMARSKLGLVAEVAWAQVRPGWIRT